MQADAYAMYDHACQRETRRQIAARESLNVTL